MRAVALAAAVAVALAATACRGDDREATPTSSTNLVVDTRDVESVLLANQRRATPDLDVRDPACPARVELREGASFRCTVAVEGVVVPYEVTPNNVASGRPGYDIRPAKAILLMPKLVAALQRNAPGSRIDCGPVRIRVLDVGATFDCTVVDSAGREHSVVLRVDNLQGDVSQVNPP